jgi:CRISPR-associated protein Cmr1
MTIVLFKKEKKMPSSITFTCQTITPMLMHGADGSTAELRPASIKGVLRFWWRAMYGNLKTIKELHDEESKIFGNKDKRSSFSIRINNSENLQIEDTNPLPHKNVFTVNGYQANQTFEVIISGQNLELIQNLFILATTLGGFGQRSRRGFGSVQITKIDDIDFIAPKTEEEIKAKIDSTFKYTSQINYPYIQNIQVGRTSNKMDDLLKKISQATHDNKCGKALFKDERMASPIFVSILKFGEEDYRPVIATLKCVSEKGFKDKTLTLIDVLQIQNKFKKAIL